MIDTDKYEEYLTYQSEKLTYNLNAKKMVEDAGLIDDNDGFLDVHYRKIAYLLAEVKQLREKLNEYEKYSICHPDGTHCCDECLERNGFEVKK
jgi:hypothetical protein|tara:strand:- start:545 stop:823 length:279 start_codon:yes stop_codon:yes gene_type:complete